MSLKELVGMKGGDFFHHLLIHHNVEHVFGYPGGAVLTLLDGILGSDKVQFILARHEQGAGHMADGYAQATGRPGVVLVTSGPGTSNLVTAMLDALVDGNPMVVICGQVAVGVLGTGAFQEIDVPALAKPCTEWFTVVQKIEDLPSSLEMAFQQAMGGRPGPVLVAIPIDVSSTIFDNAAFEKASKDISRIRASANKVAQQPSHSTLLQGTIQRVANLINTAEQPVIISGHGVLNCPRGSSLLSEISESANIPVATTLLGLGSFNETKPEALHMVGTHGAVYANYAVQNADLIIALGARLDERVVSDPESFAPKAIEAERSSRGGIIQFDIEPDNVNKVVRVTEAVIGDLSDTLPLLISNLQKGNKHRAWIEQIQAWKKQYPFPPRSPDLMTKVLPSHIPIEIDRQAKLSSTRTIVSTGAGQHQMWAARCYRWRSPKTFITSGGLGTMGFGVPAAIGAQLGCPDSQVINIDGDGSFCMTMQELLTASQYNVKIKVIIFNNGEQKMMTQYQQTYFNGRVAFSHLKNPDFVTLAESFGCEARRCHLLEELESSIQWLLEADGPAILDINLEGEPSLLPIVRVGASLDTFITEEIC
ncbi:thiamine diphosphate-binding protein [Aspergillus pseudonomiae]|uniref:Acetolactate synthase n=1 Tax=Aspergillus pseudonomiae TaxID=1506151 RepID=A0A5N7DGU9_9EURO|nr:thiamine diphosphate-binding protein [Aspergillus pseudonomiae]KAE8405641.1 thiamine diphosphate-binding protein [Aspergillus pseudonomiae]